ncbi:MAG: enterochelin esterase-like enzyme [Acidobacteria bacterium]|nr:enterochelin esterase-like enzyme [Acidobacteriota bacterium]
MKKWPIPAGAALAAVAGLTTLAGAQQEETTFHVTLSQDAAAGIAELGLGVPVDGRLFVIISRDDVDGEPRQQVGVTGVPLWGKDVEGLTAGAAVVLDTVGAEAAGETSNGGVIGYPLHSFDQVPPGEYWVQPFLNVYTTFERADGQVVQMHLNSGAGQSAFRAPGNAYGAPQRVELGPNSGQIQLVIDTVIPPIEPLAPGEVLQQGNPRDDGLARFVKIRSDVLSEFWGRDMYIGANVLVPAGYDESTESYPTLYLQGHFPGRGAPLGYGGENPRPRARELTDFWHSDEAPRMFAVTIRDANPYYDTAYSVDSANVGPYGTAITEELIPHLEREFRMIAEPWARITAGGSTGGWEALAMQIFYPKLFGGAWGWCPDPVDFNYYQIVGIYEDDNAYYTGSEWHRIERPNARRPDGNIVSTVRQENHMELARGPGSRSGGQWAIWEAVFGPVGEDGLPDPIWDPVTGEINRDTAEYWRENFDLHRYLRRNWATVGDDLRGKIHVATGDMDTYYLEQAVILLQEYLDGVDNPPAEASFEYGWKKPHCWIGASPTGSGEDITYAEFLDVVAEHVSSRAPAAANLDWLPAQD